MVPKALDQFLKVKLLRLPLIECQKVPTKRHLEARALVEHLQYRLGLGAPLQFNNEPNSITIRLITDIRDVGCPTCLGHLRDLFDHLRLRNRVRELCYY